MAGDETIRKNIRSKSSYTATKKDIIKDYVYKGIIGLILFLAFGLSIWFVLIK